MPKKPLGPPANYTRPEDFWASPVQAQAVTDANVSSVNPTGTGMPAGDPKDWEQVPRPDVPTTEQQASPKATDNSLLGGFFNVMDNIVPDDLGGMLRGDSGWTKDIPGYDQTVGALADVALTSGGAAVDAINWGSEQMNHLGAALLSWMPGGIQTLDWEQSQRVSVGQVAAANAGIAVRQANEGNPLDSLLSTLGTGPLQLFLAGINQDSALVQDQTLDDGYKILDPTFQQEVFQDDTVNKWSSGIADAAWGIFADPTIVGGKATSVIRYGSKAIEFAGLSNRALRTSGQVSKFGEEILAAGDDLAAAQSTGQAFERTAAHEQLLAVLESDANSLALNPLVQSSPLQRDTARLFAQTTTADPQTGAALVAAAAGYGPAFGILAQRSPRLYDDFTNALGVDVLAAAPTAKLTGQQIQHLDSLVDDTIVGGQLITRGGASVLPSFVRAANAYRAGKASSEFGKEALSQSPYALRLQNQVPVSRTGQWVAERLEGFAGSRPITMVRWVGKAAPSGIVYLKGGDGQTSQKELRAFASKAGMDPRQAEGFINSYINAPTPELRMVVAQAMEDTAVEKIALEVGVTPEAARAAYKSYNASRARHLDSIRRSKHGVAVDPQTREVISNPMFYTELDQSFPMLDMKTFKRVLTGNRTFLRTVNDTEVIADHFNTLWKVSVLLRLGYTQRNLAEGALRSFAVLGATAANPKAFGTLPGNTLRYASYKSAARAAKAANKAVERAATNLNLARQELEAAIQAGGNTAALTAREQDLLRQLQNLTDRAVELNDRAAARLASRKLTGRGPNVMSDGTLMPGAFEGIPGKQAAWLSAADRTVAQTFDAAMARRMEDLSASGDWKVFDPRTLPEAEMPTYWTERATRINQHFRGDPLAERIMRGQTIDELRDWLLSKGGKKYRKDLSLLDRPLRSISDVDEFLGKAITQIEAEVPAGRLRDLALERDLTAGDVAAIDGVRPDLPAIMGRGVDSAATNVFFKGLDATQGVTNKIMKYLGTIPETKVLRHPFYNAVYKDHQARLYRLAAEQGADMGNEVLRGRINSLAHAQALKATKETMYTIERLSNAAVLLRYIAPFFPAWENSIRVWGRVVYQNPAVLGYGNLLWNIPNNMGWVVDKNGEQVERSNMFRDEGNYIVWPKPVADVLRKDFGPFTPGEAVRTPQQAANVIFPGSEPWFAGVGPMTQVPLAIALRGRPELTDMLRSMMSEEMFKQIVPSGNPNVDLFEVVSPTVLRRFKQRLNDESPDSAYVTVKNTMLEDAYIQAQIDGTTLTEADIREVEAQASRFWSWQMVAALGLPFQSQLESKFQAQRNTWQQLLDNQTLTYQQKLDKFHEAYPTFGTSLDAITRGGSTSEYGLQPNLGTWQRITKDPEFVDELASLDPKLVGMFGNMGTWDDPYSYSVYTEMQSNNLGGVSATLRRKKTPEEMIRSNEVIDGWAAYNKVTAYLDDQVKKYGYSSLQAKDASWLAEIRDQAAAQISEQFPAWGEERLIYQDKLPLFLAGARKIVAHGNLAQEDPTVQTLAKYLEVRDYIASEKAKSSDDEYRKYLNQVGYEAAWQLRQSNVGFADFYDQYLSGDDFRE